jgi:hypothetical protein
MTESQLSSTLQSFGVNGTAVIRLDLMAIGHLREMCQ